MSRDSQKSKVYAWEDAAYHRHAHRSIYEPEYRTLEECEAFATPVWRCERGRMGHASKAAPTIERPAWGASSARASRAMHALRLPRWARNRWVILHEMAHLLAVGDRHGPRFVGCLIGLACRHLGMDANLLMQMADEFGVKYHVRTIGVVPVCGPSYHVRRALSRMPAMTAMDLACALSLEDGVDITARQVRGAALALIRAGEARWLRGKLVAVAA